MKRSKSIVIPNVGSRISTGLSGAEIDSFMHVHASHYGIVWGGVYPSDMLPKNPAISMKVFPHPIAYIFNYSASNQAGTHWVACKFEMGAGGRIVKWFDSYGLPPDKERNILRTSDHFHKWLSLGGIPMQYNAIDYQALGSAVCGEYCLAWCLDVLKTLNLSQAVVKILPPAQASRMGTNIEQGDQQNAEKNDEIIAQWYNMFH